jgi:hypothetical protein
VGNPCGQKRAPTGAGDVRDMFNDSRRSLGAEVMLAYQEPSTLAVVATGGITGFCCNRFRDGTAFDLRDMRTKVATSNKQDKTATDDKMTSGDDKEDWTE